MLRKEKGKVKMKTKYIASCSGGKDSTANKEAGKSGFHLFASVDT